MMADETTHSGSGRVTTRSLVISITVAVITVAVIFIIQITEPSAEKSGATRKSAALVKTVLAELGTYRPEIVALGRVEAANEIMLSARVSGQVKNLSESFTPGGFVNEGDVLLTIDPSDYENMLAMRQSELHEAKANLELELGRQNVARQEFELLGTGIENANPGLILREPQIESARAMVESAKANVANAELHLARTQVRAPFHAQIVERMTNVGSQVGVGEALAHLVGIDTYWVIATVPMRELRWISLDSQGEDPSPVRVMKPEVWGSGNYREGFADRLIGTLDEQTRMARLIITVEDPLALNSDQKKLLIGMFVEARILGRELEDVVRLKREHIRKDDTVWVMNSDTLEIREVNIVYRDALYAYIEKGLEHGERIVSTNLAVVSEGILLREEVEESGNEAQNK